LTTQKYIRKKKPITNINLYFPHREFKDWESNFKMTEKLYVVALVAYLLPNYWW
jgi:hypothetical protein